jgi:SAM-dependent methyltransferase
MLCVSTEAGPIGNTYDKYASQNPIEKRLLNGFFSRLDTLLPTSVGTSARILEVGVGEGKVATRLAKRYPHASITGLDLPDNDLRDHWNASNLTGLFASAEQIPFADNTFDLVVAVEMLEHVSRPDRVLAEIHRVAKGPVVLTVPWEPVWRIANMARGAYLKDLGNTPGHINHWTKRSFTSTVGRHFSVRSSVIAFPWTLVSADARM